MRQARREGRAVVEGELGPARRQRQRALEGAEPRPQLESVRCSSATKSMRSGSSDDAEAAGAAAAGAAAAAAPAAAGKTRADDIRGCAAALGAAPRRGGAASKTGTIGHDAKN